MNSINTTYTTDNKPNIKQISDEILKRRIKPEDRFEIAAILESMGWNDERAAEAFGSEDVFALADDIWIAIQQDIQFTPFQPEEKAGFIHYTLAMVRSFLRGIIFALPMAISVAAMLTLRFSLWSYEFLSTELATSIAIGTILSFMVVGGFTQAIARRGFFYVTQGYYNMGRRVIFYFVKLGYITCFAIAAVFLLVNAFLNIFTFKMGLVINLYFFFLSAIWLSVTVMYILQKEITFTGLLVVGIFSVYVLFGITGNIILSQLISLVLVSIAGILLVLYFFIKAEKKAEKGISPMLPRTSITLYSVLPYFQYGFLYFSFLFADRIIAWSTNDSSFMPYIIWFRGHYELGLDFALLAIILPMGFNEVVVNKLMLDLEASQKNFTFDNLENLSKRYLNMYFTRFSIVALISCASSFMVYFTVVFINNNPQINLYLHRSGSLLGNPDMVFVFVCALCAYGIVAIALMNAVILFSLSQPVLVTKSITPALITNMLVGFLLSRWFHYYFAVFGLIAGALVFLYLTTRQITKVLRNLDYYLYATS